MHHPVLYNYLSPTITFYPWAMNFIILEKALFLIITMKPFHRVKTQEQRFSKNYCIHIEPYPNIRTPYPAAMKFTIFKETFFLILTVYLVYPGTKEEFFEEVSLEPRPNSRTLDPGAMNFTLLKEALFNCLIFRCKGEDFRSITALFTL